jgi:hypothetical protein
LPGHRTGQGSDSVLPYLKEALKIKPQEPIGPMDIDPVA